MTLDLEAIKRRCEEATGGPWLVDKENPGMVRMPSVDKFAGFIIGRSAEFVAHAREDVPALVAEIDEMKITLYQIEILSDPKMIQTMKSIEKSAEVVALKAVFEIAREVNERLKKREEGHG